MIAIVSGTNRENAVSMDIARQYSEILKEKGVENIILNLQDLPPDFIFSSLYGNTGKNEQFNRATDIMNTSEKFVFIIPEYNGSFPGVLKAFLDGLDRERALAHKKCALVGISAGDQGAGPALSHFTDILNYCGTHVLAYRLRIPNIGRLMTDHKITDSGYVARMHKQADMLIGF